MRDKIIEIFKKYRFVPGIHEGLEDIRLSVGTQEEIADEILALRYQIAREVFTEWKDTSDKDHFGFPYTPFMMWLSQRRKDERP